ncbi:MAG: hypothetical protein EBY16_05110 [Gammaproteobacteria bacterium]|nr:hypothetical protein [Gammaproteobacteria bacterium]
MQESPDNPEIELPAAKDEQASDGSTPFFQDLKKNGNQYIGVQSVLDALDLWNSSIKLYFDAVDFDSSAADLNDWLSYPIGATCFFLGAGFISTFAYLGNGVNKNQSAFSKLADTNWPYLRDMLKGMKWTFKGTRSFMMVASVLGQYQLINYLTPVGLGLGVLSACNRMWNRNMVETRKSLQEKNDAFRRQVKGINACFHEVTRDLVFDGDGKIREDILKNIYAGSILKIPKKEGSADFEYYIVDNSGNLEMQPDFAQNPFIQRLNAELVSIQNSVPGQKIVPRIYWDKFEILLEEYKLEEHRPNETLFLTVLAHKKEYFKILLDPDSDPSQFIQNQAVFQENSRRAFASAGLSGLLNAPYYFLGILSMVTLPPPIFAAAVLVCSFFMLLNVAAELYQESDYQRRLRISQLKADLVKTKRLLVIEWQQANFEVIKPVPQEDAAELNDDDGLVGTHSSEYSSSQEDDTEPTLESNLGNYLLKTEIETLRRLLDKESELNEILGNFLQTSAAGTEMSSETRKYLASVFKKDRNSSSSFYDELDSQQQAILAHCIKIAKYEQDYHEQYGQLEQQLRLSQERVWWQGLRNGLVVFGAFNSLLMTVASMKFLFGIGFVPMFFYVSVIAGLTLLFCTTLYTILSVNPTEVNIADDQDTFEAIHHKTSHIFVADSTRKIIDGRDIQASKNLLITENAEVFRQLLSGFKKGMKFLQTLSVYLPFMSNSESMLAKLIFIAAGIAFAAFFALKGLRGLMRVDDDAYKNSFIFKFLTGHQSTTVASELTSPKPLPKSVSAFWGSEELSKLRSASPPRPPRSPSPNQGFLL